MLECRVHVFVSGRVQGVWYRESTRHEAEALSLAGFARNLPDGRVEIVAEGPREALERLVSWCRQGPPAARVDHLEVEWLPATGDATGWTTRR